MLFITLIDSVIWSVSNVAMMSILNKIKKNDLYFIGSFLVLAFGPPLFKFLIAGTVGPSFSFYYFTVWIPVVTLTLATMKGWRETAVAGILILGALIISLVNYPPNPAMDFRRQLVHQANLWIVGAAFIAILTPFLMRRIRRR